MTTTPLADRHTGRRISRLRVSAPLEVSDLRCAWPAHCPLHSTERYIHAIHLPA